MTENFSASGSLWNHHWFTLQTELSHTNANTFVLASHNSTLGFPGGLDGKESACNVGDPGSIPVLGRSLGDGNGNSLQYSCLENSMDREAWQATVHGIAKCWTRLGD